MAGTGMNLALAIVLGLAIGAALGWGISVLVTRMNGEEEIPRWPAAAGGVLGLVVAIPVMSFMFPPSAEDILAAYEDEAPYLAVIQDRYPDEYRDLVEVIDRNRNSPDQQRVLLELREVVWPLIDAKLAAADDSILIEFAQLARDQARELAESNPHMCPAWLTGQAVDFTLYLEPASVERENEFYATLLGTNDTENPELASPLEAEQFFGDAVPRIGERLGLDEFELIAAFEQRGPGRDQCLATAELMDELLRAPREQRGRLLRMSLSS